MKQTLNAWLESLRGKRLCVAGLGVSNRPLVRMLLEAGLDVVCYDKTEHDRLDPAVLELEALGARLETGPDYLDRISGDVIFRTPGLHPEKLAPALAGGAELTSEMEAFFAVCPCPILAVTGSDGKTTTTSLIAELLRRAERTVWVGGNIGRPLLSDVPRMQAADVAVLELSSFQLLTMHQSPQVAVVTNLAPNHLDIHKGMEEYIAAKKNLFLHQQPSGRLILNLDNDITRGFAAEARCPVAWFSRQAVPEAGVFFRSGAIWRKTAAGEEKVLDRSDLLLPGDHNIENFMAAMAAVEGLVPDEVILDTARTFQGVAHRIQRVRVLDGVAYYNDSIASSPSRTIAGLRSFSEKVILIAGGYDKHIPYDDLGPEIVAHVKTLILTGATADKIRAAVLAAPGYDGSPAILGAASLAEAVQTAHSLAKAGDVVLLSPASASFDCFRNFEERGNVFMELVGQL